MNDPNAPGGLPLTRRALAEAMAARAPFALVYRVPESRTGDAFLRLAAAVAHRRGDFFQRCCGLFQGRCLLFGPA